MYEIALEILLTIVLLWGAYILGRRHGFNSAVAAARFNSKDMELLDEIQKEQASK